jgi:hypothetical protein
VHADLFDEQPQEFLRLLRAFVGEDLVELVGEAGEGGRVRRRVRTCGEAAGEVGFLLAKGLEALTVAMDAFLQSAAESSPASNASK